MGENAKRVGDLTQLIAEENFVGAVIQQDYEQMLIATTDYLQINSGGVPKNCFLTVAGRDEDGEVSEVLLVSVRGPVPMQTQRELLAVREELANSLTQGVEPTRNDTLDVKLSSQALTCKILGTFYKDEEGAIQFGADVDNVRSSASLRVYRPTGEALSFIASFSTRSRNTDAMLEVGKVRYTETRKKVDEGAAVYMNVEDLLATKTALFGMTRSGKALANYTRIPVPVSEKFPEGWARNEELEVGDLVLSSEGNAVPIIELTPWDEKTIYRVHFSDGQHVDTSGNHLWNAEDLQRTTNFIRLTAKLKKYAHLDSRAKKAVADYGVGNWASLKLIEAISGYPESLLHEVAKSTNMSTKYGSINGHYHVPELLTHMLNFRDAKKLVDTDFIRNNLLLDDGSASRWGIECFNSTFDLSADVDLPGDPEAIGYGLIKGTVRRIPAIYLRASLRQRSAILSGINKAINEKESVSEFAQGKIHLPSEEVAEDVLELIRSLGHLASRAGRTVTFTHPGKNPHAKGTQFFASERSVNIITAIEEIGRGRVRCLTVDSPDSLHLVEGFIPTHNSNTTKVILQKIHQFTHERGKPVAQLIMDPQGEYANSNSQDGSALANIGDESQVSIYKMMEKRSNPKEKFLQFNLFAEENLALTYDLILAEIRNGISAEANYISPLFSQEFETLGENASPQQRVHYARKKLAFFGLMYEGIKNYPVKPFAVGLPESVLDKIREKKTDVEFSAYKANEVLIRSTGDAWRVSNILLEARAEKDLNDSWVREFEEGDAGVFLDQLFQINDKGRNGVKGAIARIEPLHSIDAEGDVRENVWQDIQAGKLIVVDLSRGSMETSRALSELIVNYLLTQASARFVDGLDPVPFQIVVEEAHNLFDRESRKGESDPWVRISKEAAKYHIGLVYATQEISSVDKRILSNTSNFVISALSSSKEIVELGNYYSFGDWADHIKRIETKGFVRLKTQSSPFIVPVQMEKFEVEAMSAVSSKVARKNEKVSTTVEREPSKKAREFVPAEALEDFSVPTSGEFDELEF